MFTNNCYDVLGVPKNVMTMDLRPAFLRTAAQYQNPEEIERLRDIQVAYKTLVEKRELYDQFGEQAEVLDEITERIGITEDAEISVDGYS